jgi:hypothetical protein
MWSKSTYLAIIWIFQGKNPHTGLEAVYMLPKGGERRRKEKENSRESGKKKCIKAVLLRNIPCFFYPKRRKRDPGASREQCFI